MNTDSGPRFPLQWTHNVYVESVLIDRKYNACHHAVTVISGVKLGGFSLSALVFILPTFDYCTSQLLHLTFYLSPSQQIKCFGTM